MTRTTRVTIFERIVAAIGRTERPSYAARVVAALAVDPDAMRYSGRVVDVADLADLYGIDDVDGSRPHNNQGRFRRSDPLPPPPVRG